MSAQQDADNLHKTFFTTREGTSYLDETAERENEGYGHWGDLDGESAFAVARLIKLVDTVQSLITQAESCNFTDRHGHSLEMNAAYRALKASVNG